MQATQAKSEESKMNIYITPFKDCTGLNHLNVFHKHWGRSRSPVANLAYEDAHAKNEHVKKVYIEVKAWNCNILILFLQSGVYQQL